MKNRFTPSAKCVSLMGLVVLGCGALVGCQVDIGGQTLPSAYYLKDDIQYFPPGYEFKLQREADAQKAYRDEVEQQAIGKRGPSARSF